MAVHDGTAVQIDVVARTDPLELQTFLRQPFQAAQKTSLSIMNASSYWNPIDAFWDVSTYTDEDWALVDGALGRVSASDEERVAWLGDMRKGLWDALVALELTLLPHLESVVYILSHETTWIRNVLEKVARSQQVERAGESTRLLLPKLRSVQLSWWDTENGMALDELVRFKSVPSVQEVDADMVSSEYWEALPGMFFSLRTLRLSMSSIDSEALRDLIYCCPQLETFAYETGGAIVGHSILAPAVLSPALATLKPCLQELVITDDEDDVWDEDVWAEEGNPELPMASFADFEKLHTLSLRACNLVGEDKTQGSLEANVMELDLEENAGLKKTAKLVDVVPKSLKMLSLNHCGSGISAQLGGLLTRKEEVTPFLEHIEIAVDEAIVEEGQMLVQKFAKKNVVIQIQVQR